MKPKFILVLLLFLSCLGHGLFAQTAEKMDQILESKEISYDQAAFIILPAAGLISETASLDEAFMFAWEHKWLRKAKVPEDPISLGELSYLIMKAFDMKSGFMYAIFPGPRYAFRELCYRSIIQGRSDPSITLSGERLLNIQGRLLAQRGE